MPLDIHKLKPGELCRLLNSTPLGEVIDDAELRRQRLRAGLRLGDGPRVDLLRYVAWLVGQRHDKKVEGQSRPDLSEASSGGAALASKGDGDEPNLTERQQKAITMLLAEPTHTAAAQRAGIGTTTLYRWLHQAHFRVAYRLARRELVESAIGRLQAAAGQAVDTLVCISHRGRRDGDRVRASMALLEHAIRAIHDADSLHGEIEGDADPAATGTGHLVQLLANRLRQVDHADMPTSEKVRLTTTLADSLLRAIGIDVLEKRLEALEAILGQRAEDGKK